MKLIKLKCPNCGSSFKVEKGQKEFFCEYCRTTTLLDDGVIKVEHTIVDKNKEEGLKIFKGFGIFSLTVFCIIFVTVIAIIGVVIFNISKMSNNKNDIINNKIDNIVDNKSEEDSDYSEAEIMGFNAQFELYNGTQSLFFMKYLLDNISLNNKKQKEHIVIVLYDNKEISDSEDITDLKHNLDDDSEYEVSLDYDEDGFVNRVNIIKIN